MKIYGLTPAPGTISKKPFKRTSDELLKEANLKHMHRIAIKNILNQLVKKDLVETELTPELRKIFRGNNIYSKKLRRYYWIGKKGKKIVNDIESLNLI